MLVWLQMDDRMNQQCSTAREGMIQAGSLSSMNEYNHRNW